jgi:hypothetical protein
MFQGAKVRRRQIIGRVHVTNKQKHEGMQRRNEIFVNPASIPPQSCIIRRRIGDKMMQD